MLKVRRFSLFAAASILLLLVGAIQGLDLRSQPSIQRGISYVTWSAGDYSQPDADLALVKLTSTGATWMSLIVTGYQDTITSTAIFTTTDTPTDGDLIHVIAQAHALGLKVMLKPHVDPLDSSVHWRGQIGEEFVMESDWEAWFASYRSFIDHYADLAETYGADQFCVGTELSGTTHRPDDWRRVIDGVRTRFSGPITYAANWGGEDTSITWWDAVDYIGVDAYWPLTDKDDPTLAELRAGWVPHLATLADLASTWHKPILFTEIGYSSEDGTNRHPACWQCGGAIDLQEQADAYRATFESVYGQPWFAGIFWWSWRTDPFDGASCDSSFTPHDKPAEDILRAWYGGLPRRPPTSIPQPDYSRTMDIYTDRLGPSWHHGGWNVTDNLAATDQVYSGTHAISVTLGAWGALSLHANVAFDSGPYHWLEFYIHGSPAGEQHLWAFFYNEDNAELRKRPVDDCRYIEGGTIEAGTWKRVRIPLDDLNTAGQSLSSVVIQDRTGQGPDAFWMDEIRLVGGTWRVYLPVVCLQ